MEIIEEVEKLKESDIGKTVNCRIREFEKIGKNPDKIFSELCFCILTANFQAEKSIKIQEGIGNGFCELSESELSAKLGGFGHRFPNMRARYIFDARKFREELLEKLRKENDFELREWIVRTIGGIGMKEASHFLRNIGFKNLSIIDFHIIDLLVREKLIDRPKMLNKKKYLDIEEELMKLASKLGLNLAELDLYLWYLETEKVLK
ncbi:N-glycosylase [Candidatus Woesearchaeota archaeon CG10_big_fil_rev_8_21_14_0_10_34_12]|nr:MAG: N-glycosylase [Candidatus Woesearchaeota archaeon CG10_big_fil_rev_8_21_14_0_10_34_12]